MLNREPWQLSPGDIVQVRRLIPVVLRGGLLQFEPAILALFDLPTPPSVVHSNSMVERVAEGVRCMGPPVKYRVDDKRDGSLWRLPLCRP